MDVTYLGHSGFLLEWPEMDWLFDYSEGELPTGNGEKPLVVFVSHAHSDHFNPAIFTIRGYREIHYILSEDTREGAQPYLAAGMLHFMEPEEELVLPVVPDGPQLRIRTLRSTDCGVAFLVEYDGRTIYHAGDLNWWVWPGETEQYNREMTADFLRYTQPLEGKELFLAFLPLDPRQGDWYSKGMTHVLSLARVRHIFPMHLWNDYSVIPKFLRSAEGKPFQEQIVLLTAPGQVTHCPVKPIQED